MAYGINTGGRTKGTPNKVTSEVKNKLVELIDGTISELSTANLNVANKIKLLEIALNYCIPSYPTAIKKPIMSRRVLGLNMYQALRKKTIAENSKKHHLLAKQFV